MLIILYLISIQGATNNIIPIISLYVFAGYRLMPAAQLIYASSTQIAFASPSIEKVYNDMKNLNPINFHQDKGVLPLNPY